METIRKCIKRGVRFARYSGAEERTDDQVEEAFADSIISVLEREGYVVVPAAGVTPLRDIEDMARRAQNLILLSHKDA